MTNQNERFSNEEKYGREIFEAISYSNAFPVTKKKLIYSLEKLITELFNLIDEEELEDYINAKKWVQHLSENEVENLCFSVAELYKDIEEHF